MSELLVGAQQAGKRLDALLASELPEHSRSYWQKAIKATYVNVNGGAVNADYRLHPGDKIEVNVPARELEEIELPVIYEDDDVIVFDKPAGMLTHSKGTFNPEFTVAQYMRDHFYQDAGGDRPGIVHRLDRDTSGVIICAKHETAGAFLQRQFSERKVTKTYLAVVEGTLKDSELVLDWPIGRNPKRPQTFRVHAGGKSAQTAVKVLTTSRRRTLVELRPATGRTHQLRVHMKKLEHPIAGDKLYGNDSGGRLMLHAYKLQLNLPSGSAREFESPVPSEFLEALG
jgi:23S rRNA pseudouridine1911/1915/1917 synthase